MPAKYSKSIRDFLKDTNEHIVGSLTLELSNYEINKPTRISWDNEITLLKDRLHYVPSEWSILLEYPIPRRAKRIDIVILAKDVVFIIEYKDNASSYSKDAVSQLEDYAYDLRDFHKQSDDRIIIPILLAPLAKDLFRPDKITKRKFVQDTLFANKENLPTLLNRSLELFAQNNKSLINSADWNNSEYLPTPTIIEVAQELYAGKEIKEMTRSHAGPYNLQRTTSAIFDIVAASKRSKRKSICFLTGTPGAGKTLVGLNVAHNTKIHLGKSAFLSGNGPLVKILTESLARSHSKQSKIPLIESRREVHFVQNVHKFLTTYFENTDIPPDQVLIFDEAQRAWNAEQSNRKFKRNYSEAEMLLSIMNRFSDWAVIIALIGSGQEINTGEAGLAEWGKTLQEKYPNWDIHISPELKEGESHINGYTLFETAPRNLNIYENENLHLKVSLRSFKAEKLSEWVNAVLACQTSEAKSIYANHLTKYPVYLTRDLNMMKEYLREQNKGSRRSGVIASSGARRLRALGLDVTIDLDVASWFLNSYSDVRSSSFHELPATEFAIQGLELDYTGLCWGDDFRKSSTSWSYHSFKGSKWQSVNNQATQNYILNKYRVLLTRGRSGMVIFVPGGSDVDHTRPHSHYDPTFEYLYGIGLPML